MFLATAENNQQAEEVHPGESDGVKAEAKEESAAT